MKKIRTFTDQIATIPFTEKIKQKPFTQTLNTKTFITYAERPDPRSKEEAIPDSWQSVLNDWKLNRTTHLYIPGMSGFGKTSLMANLIIDDIKNEQFPLIIIDPKGSAEGLVQRVLPYIPESLIKKTHYISLDHPVPIDLLGHDSDFEKNLIRDDVRGILQRFSFGQWGPTMQEMVNNLVPTLLEIPDSTFLDISRFLETDKGRQKILARTSRERQDYWNENKPTNQDRGPIMARMSNFKDEPLKSIVDCKRGSGLSVAKIIEDKDILLVELTPRSMAALILGALIMSRVQQAILRRSPDKQHPVCTVYADEFHNFLTSRMDEMLLEGRSHGLSLCMANPNPKKLSEIWDDILGAVSMFIIFKLRAPHAALFKDDLRDPPFETRDYQKALLQRKKDIRWLREAVADQKKFVNARSDEMTIDECKPFWDALAKTEEQLEELEDNPVEKPEPPEPFLKQITHLQKGEAVYISPHSTTYRINTPRPPQYSKSSFLAEIIENTRAQISQKRTVDNPSSSDTKNMVPLKGNGTPSTDDSGNNKTPRNLLSDPSKKAGPPTSR